MGGTERFFIRPHYQTLLESYIDTPAIKVLSGVRRCGKSTLLLMLADTFRSRGIPERNIFYKKMDSFDVPLEPDAEWLQDSLKGALEQKDPAFPLYLLLDEIQEVAGWEKVIRRAHTEEKTDVYLTGSNAFLLSSDLATYLSGRYVELPVWPLSFKEYRSFCEQAQLDEDTSKGDQFARYLLYGGMPGLFAVPNFTEDFIARELTAIHDTVILNDVAKRFELRDIDLLEKLLRYVYTTSGNLFSSRKVANALTSAGRKTTIPTVDSYLDALERAFLLNACEQEGIAGKQVLQPLKKWYAPDTGLRNREVGFRSGDIGFQLESVVYCELRRRGYRVAVGAGPQGEIDFVANKNSEKLYVQVCDEITGDATFARETSAFDGIGDSFPKIILTRDKTYQGTTEKGIQIRDIVDWLLD